MLGKVCHPVAGPNPHFQHTEDTTKFLQDHISPLYHGVSRNLVPRKTTASQVRSGLPCFQQLAKSVREEYQVLSYLVQVGSLDRIQLSHQRELPVCHIVDDISDFGLVG